MAVIFAFLWYVYIRVQHINSISTPYTLKLVVTELVIVVVVIVVIVTFVDCVLEVVVVVLYLVVVSMLELSNHITHIEGPKLSVSPIDYKFNPTLLYTWWWRWWC